MAFQLYVSNLQSPENITISSIQRLLSKTLGRHDSHGPTLPLS